MPYVEPWYKTHVGFFFLFFSDSIRESFYFCSAGIAKSTWLWSCESATDSTPFQDETLI